LGERRIAARSSFARVVNRSFTGQSGGTRPPHRHPRQIPSLGLRKPFKHRHQMGRIDRLGVYLTPRQASMVRAVSSWESAGSRRTASIACSGSLVMRRSYELNQLCERKNGGVASTIVRRTYLQIHSCRLAAAIGRFTEIIGLKRFAIYIFDYGAPVGLRMATKHPERITAIISQNGNAYEEGLSEGWNPIQAYWHQPTQANRDALRSFLAPETTRFQYTHGVSDPSLVSPDGRSLDDYYLARPGAHEAQLDLLLDYASNVALYPRFQSYFRNQQPPFLAVWGKNDPFFLPAGAEAFRRDIPGADVRFFDTGHFALETHSAEIAAAIRDFLDRALPVDEHLPNEG
jgi:pimeloyl-ACP methyl ester carboxylesterase